MPLQRIAVVGAGAVGGYIGGKLALAGHDVRVIDSWVAHIERIRRKGLRVSEPAGSASIKVDALHVSDVQSLIRTPIDVALICTKSYDTAWSAMMVKPYLSDIGCVVSVQNGINEESGDPQARDPLRRRSDLGRARARPRSRADPAHAALAVAFGRSGRCGGAP